MDTYLVILFFEKCFITFNTLYCETLLVYMQTITYMCNCNIYIYRLQMVRTKEKEEKINQSLQGRGKGEERRPQSPPQPRRGPN